MSCDPNLQALVVDNFSTMRRILGDILRQLGFTNIIIEAVQSKISNCVIKSFTAETLGQKIEKIFAT